MSVDELNKIDFISTTPEGETRLTIADHYDWSNQQQHLLVLQEKLNAYIQFIEDGEVFEKYPDAKKDHISIDVVFKFEPTTDAILFLNRCKETINDFGIGFAWRTLE